MLRLVIGGGIALLGLLAASKKAARVPRVRGPSKRQLALQVQRLQELEAAMQSVQLAENRARGKRYERRAERAVREAFPDHPVHLQVSTKDPNGKRGRADMVLDHRHRDGRVTPFELKDVKRLEPKHVRQADEYQAAIERTYGVPTNRTVILVPPDTHVPAKLAARGDIERLPRKRRSR